MTNDTQQDSYWNRYSPSLHQEIDQLSIEDRIYYSFLDPCDLTQFYFPKLPFKRLPSVKRTIYTYSNIFDTVFLPNRDSSRYSSKQHYSLISYRIRVKHPLQSSLIIVDREDCILSFNYWSERNVIPTSLHSQLVTTNNISITNLLLMANTLREYWSNLRQRGLLNEYELIKTYCTSLGIEGGYKWWFAEPISQLSLIKKGKSRLNAITNKKKS